MVLQAASVNLAMHAERVLRMNLLCNHIVCAYGIAVHTAALVMSAVSPRNI